MPATRPAPSEIAAVRRFNRLVTRRIGALGERHLRSAYSLTEVRVLYELAHRRDASAAELGRTLGLDAGYLSRLLRAFIERGLVKRTASPRDGRESRLDLTAKGRAAFATLDRLASEQVGALLGALDEGPRRRLVGAMRTVEEVLGAETQDGEIAASTASPASTAESAEPEFILRPPKAGDLGWVVHRHGVLYAEEYGWDERFEGLVAAVIGKFVARWDPERERCWIAERRGEVVGSVFLVKKAKTVAQLRLLYVEPSARGLGIGAGLVAACVGAAKELGYRKITLWTQRNLTAARRIYARAGFERVLEERHESFGHTLRAEVWERAL